MYSLNLSSSHISGLCATVSLRPDVTDDFVAQHAAEFGVILERDAE